MLPRSLSPSLSRTILFVFLSAGAPLAHAQVTIKPDGQWRHLFGAGASVSSGNADTLNLTLSADSVRATEIDKWSVTGRALYARNDDVTTGERLSLGTVYNRDLTPDWFGFGSADLLLDRPANLTSRSSVAAGAGLHVLRSETAFWDVSAGLGYTLDRYETPTEIDGSLRERYGRAELLLAEESRHQLTPSTALSQKLRVLPNLRETSEFRAEFESNLTVAINSSLNLTAGLAYRYNSDPGIGVERGDLLFTTGLSYRID